MVKSAKQSTRANLPVIRISGKPVYAKVAEDIDFYELFKKVEQRFDTCFLTESLGTAGLNRRYSTIGFGPERTVRARGKTLFVDDVPYDTPNPYFALREMLPATTFTREYAGGLTGYLGYDTVNYIEPTLSVKEHPDFDAFMFGVYTDGLIFDTLTGELSYFYYNTDRSDIVRELLAAKPRTTSASATALGDSLSQAEHAKTVESVKEHIRAGDIFQCEVGFKSKYQLKGDALHIYGRLREINPSPHMYYLKFDDKKIFGASPELFFDLRDGAMAVHPLAGTIRRGQDAAEDQRLARQLLNDLKENAEHNMLVDLHRNDVGRVAQFGSVRVRTLKNIIRLSHVQHITSEVTGSLHSGEDMFSAVAASFPMGTMTGAPKIEAMKIIDANEQEARGPYAGAAGHFGFNGNCTFAVIVRSLFVAGEDAYAQTCGGIVYDSQVETEYDEVKRKLAAMDKAARG